MQIGAVLLGLSALLFLAAALNIDELRQKSRFLFPNRSTANLNLYNNLIPWNRLLFPVLWVLYYLYGGAIRHFALRMLGSRDSRMTTELAIA